MRATSDGPEVLIVGAGPVGLALALDLGRRGVHCRLVEQASGPRDLPKMERCNARTMEIFRRLGVADRIRAGGLQAHVPMDVFIVSQLCEPPILRLPYASVDDARARAANVHDGSAPLEPYQLISQYTLEPILLAAVRELANVEVAFDCALRGFTQDGGGVEATLEHHDGRTEVVHASYLAGCDGGTSTVRKALGIELRGRGNIAQLRQVFFRSDDLTTKVPRVALGRHFYVADTEARMIGTAIVVQDDQRHFVFHTSLPEDADLEEAIIDAVGIPIDVHIRAVNRWKLHLLLAERYSAGRAFLAGDAARLVIPQGGLGMNTGIADATDLAWKLTAALRGWAGPRLLDSYNHERRQVGERVIEASRIAAEATATWRSASTGEVRESSVAGRRVRTAIARSADVEQRKSHEMLGIELGYRYEDSPVVIDEEPPGHGGSRFDYVPTARPGSRLPHVWCDDGLPLHDRLTDGFSLLRLGRTSVDTDPLVVALRSFGAPVEVLDLPDGEPRRVYEADLVLVRPDLHVAWRGDTPPRDVSVVAATVLGV